MLHTGDVLVDQLLIPFVLWIFVVAVDLDQQLGKGVDTMHLTLDRWVGTFPRAAGWTITLVDRASLKDTICRGRVSSALPENAIPPPALRSWNSKAVMRMFPATVRQGRIAWLN